MFEYIQKHKTGFIVGAIVVIFIVLLAVFLPGALAHSSNQGSASTHGPKNLLEQSDILIKEMYTNSQTLAAYASSYAADRLADEATGTSALANANTALDAVKTAQTNCLNAYNNVTGSMGTVPSTTTYLTDSSTVINALNTVKTIVNANGATPSGTTSGNTAGTALQRIETARAQVITIYSTINGQISIAASNLTNLQANQTTVATAWNSANTALNDLITKMGVSGSTYTNNIKSSTEYTNLQNSISNATYLKNQIDALVTAEGSSYPYSQSLKNASINLGNATGTAQNYLAQVVGIFALLTAPTSKVSPQVAQIISIFNEILSRIGSYLIAGVSPTPIPLPVTIPTSPSPSIQTILSYYNSIVTAYSNAISQYNTLLSTYNTVANALMQIETLSNTVVSGLSSSSNSVNQQLLKAQATLQPFFPGGTTTGIVTYPTSTLLATSPIPTYTTVGPNPYTPMTAKYQ